MGVGSAVALAGLGRGLRDAAGALSRGRQREEERKEQEETRRRQRLGSVAEIVAAGGHVGDFNPASSAVPMKRIGELDGQPVWLPSDGMTPASRAVDRRARDKERADAEAERTAYQERYDALEGLPEAQRKALARSSTAFTQYMDDQRRPAEETPAARLRRIEEETRVRERVQDEFDDDDDDRPTPAQRRAARNSAASGFRQNANAQTQNLPDDPRPEDYGFIKGTNTWDPAGGPKGTRREFQDAGRRATTARETAQFEGGRERYRADSTMRAGRHEETTGEDPDESLDFEIAEARRGIQEANRLRLAAHQRNPNAGALADRLFNEAVAEIRGGLSPEARRALGTYGNLKR